MSVLVAEDFPKRSSPASEVLVTLSARTFRSDDLSDNEADGDRPGDDRVFSSTPGVSAGAEGGTAIVSSSTSNAPPECERARLT